jgi:hypothetical protein
LLEKSVAIEVRVLAEGGIAQMAEEQEQEEFPLGLLQMLLSRLIRSCTVPKR